MTRSPADLIVAPVAAVVVALTARWLGANKSQQRRGGESDAPLLGLVTASSEGGQQGLGTCSPASDPPRTPTTQGGWNI